MGWGCWGSWPWPVLCSGCRSERAPDPLGANARGWSRFAMGREAACLLLSASVQSLCSGCPVLFCTFRRGFFFNLYSRNVTLWLLFFVCSRAPRCKPRAPSKRCFYILHSIHCFAAACGDAGLLQEVVECASRVPVPGTANREPRCAATAVGCACSGAVYCWHSGLQNSLGSDQ